MSQNEGIDILNFKNGILGFENVKKYTLEDIDCDLPFMYLKAQGEEHPCFVICDPLDFVPNFLVRYDRETLLELEAGSPDDLRCFAIATIPENFLDMTINLKSPLVFNIKNGLAKQYVTESTEYPLRYKLFTEAVDKVC